jgi:4-alpha-glucanotransferase
LSPELLVEDGYLSDDDLTELPAFDDKKVIYETVAEYKKKLLDLAFERFKSSSDRSEFDLFCRDNSYWLEDFALFMILKRHFDGQVWNQWPQEYRDRHNHALKSARHQFKNQLLREKMIQFLCYRQWFKLKKYCNDNAIQLYGDIPIYVNLDSADVWSNPRIFKLSDDKHPIFVAGVPPDYFSETGQLWGNPVYDWDVLKEHNFDWWIRRLTHNFRLYDMLRIDHFRGLVAYWEVPAGEETAINGKWVKVPVDDFFNTIMKHFFLPPIIAEDLGMITADVRETLMKYSFPGMKVLIFGFGADDPDHPYLPHNYEETYVAYTATHDNNTVRGWYEQETTPEIKARLFKYIGREISQAELNWELIRLTLMSRAGLAIIPMQDILGLDAESRMNRPSYGDGNWQWRLQREQITDDITRKLAEMTYTYGRA